eukprot:UN08686
MGGLLGFCSISTLPQMVFQFMVVFSPWTKNLIAHEAGNQTADMMGGAILIKKSFLKSHKIEMIKPYDDHGYVWWYPKDMWKILNRFFARPGFMMINCVDKMTKRLR